MKITRIQAITAAAASLPGVILAIQLFAGDLSANPIQASTIRTGRSALYLLFASLYCRPLFNFLGLSMFLQIRKTTGLFAFYYALIHFLIFSALDYQLNFSWILPELEQKPFLQIGLAALVLLIPLAITSNRSIKKSMGKWWGRIHKFVYLIGAMVVIHIALASKGDIIRPAVLISIFILALLWRIPPLKDLHVSRLPKWAYDLNAVLIQ